MTETSGIVPIDALSPGAALRRLGAGLAGREVMLVGGPHPGATHRVARIYRSARERFQAITDIGLSSAIADGERPARHSHSSRGVPELSYLAAGDPAGRPVVFIHGTPGAAADWTPFLRNVPSGQRRLAVDRPGFGQSGPGAPVVALAEQARAIASLIEAGSAPAVVVGSSYGGPVALQLAAGHPEVVSGVLLVGAAADPARERTHPLQRLAALRAIGGLLPRALAHSNAELLALRRELEVLGTGIGRIRAPVTILQGLHDTLVPAENAAYLGERLVGAMRRRLILVARAGHFLHILSSDLVEQALGHVLADARESGTLPDHRITAGAAATGPAFIPS